MCIVPIYLIVCCSNVGKFEFGEGIVVMPLAPNSKPLYATMSAKNGKPAWKNPIIELLPDGGIIANFNETLNTLLDRIETLEQRLENKLANDTDKKM